MSRNQQLFCSRPFKWFELTQEDEIGDVYMCCPGWLNVPIGNLRYQSAQEIWNGEKARELRRSILDGSFRYCDHFKCSSLITVSGPVQKVKDVADEELREAIDTQRTIVPYGPREISCCYDRSCNLSCPSCRTEVIIDSNKRQQILEVQDKIHRELLKDAHALYITGSGDPFGSPFFRKWLRTLRGADLPSLRKLHLHTNGQLWTAKMWGTLSEDIQPLVKSAEISMDAASSRTYSINRRGGSFERLLENLEFISALRKRGPLRWVTISMVVQENNFLEMPDFVGLGRRFNFDLVYFSKLENWGTYSEEEFKRRAVHLPTHPRHAEFAGVLARLRKGQRGRRFKLLGKTGLSKIYGRLLENSVSRKQPLLESHVLRETRVNLGNLTEIGSNLPITRFIMPLFSQADSGIAADSSGGKRNEFV